MRARLTLALVIGLVARFLLSAIQTATMRNALESTYGTTAAFGAVYTTTPGASAGTEPSGGSPAYARKALTWTGNAPRTVTVTFDIPTSTTIVGAGVHTLVTAGTYLDGTTVTSQAFSSQGTYAVTFSYTQS